MIEINLLPGAGRKTKRRAGQSVDFGAIAAGLSGTRARQVPRSARSSPWSSASAPSAFLYTSQTRASRRRSTSAAGQAVRDSTRYANFLKDRYHAEAMRDTLLRQVNIIRSLDDDRYIWPHVMDEVSRALPQYTWLTSLGFTGTPQGSEQRRRRAEDRRRHVGRGEEARPPKRLETDDPEGRRSRSASSATRSTSRRSRAS